MLRGAVSLLIVLFLGVVLAGRFAAVPPPADFRYVNSSDVHTLDPARMSWTQDLRLALNLWEGLSTYDPATLALDAGAAEFPPDVSADGRVWTFHIRQDARWSNGDPVRACDFVRGWRRAIEPGTAADYAFFLTQHVAGAREYLAWRAQAVETLTALSRLSEGWSVGWAERRRLLESESAIEVRPALAEWRAARGDGRPDEELVLEAELPWPQIHRQALQRHAEGMPARFASVGLETPDERTLVVRLRGPCPYFADLTAFPALSPIHESIERLRDGCEGLPLTPEGLVTYLAQWTRPEPGGPAYPGLITNGPYRLASWRFKRAVRLEVNPFHRDAGRLACRSIEALVYEDPNTALLAYEAGDVDFIPTIEVSYAHQIAHLARSGARPDFHACMLAGTFFFNFNCADAEVNGAPNPFVDARVRRAFCLAVDRRAIVDRVLQRGDRAARSFVPPGTLTGYAPPVGVDYDVVEARRLLSEAGYDRGEALPVVEILFNTGTAHMPVCQAVARMWETHLGVRMELRGKESKAFAEDKARRRFLVAQANWYADYDDPTTFLDVLSCDNGNNDSGYCSAEYDARLAEASIELDAPRRMQRLADAEALLVQRDCPVLPLFHYAGVTAIRPGVSGLTPNPRLIFPFRGVRVAR